MIWLGMILSFLCVPALSASLPPFQAKHLLTQPSWESKPFWRNSETQEKMHSVERTIVVSVKSESEKDHVRLTLKGAGIIRRKVEDTYRIATQFARIKEWSPYFREAKYDENSQQVAIEVGVWKFTASSLVQFAKARCEDHDCILWEVLAGTFKGLRGGIQFVADQSKWTEISITSEYEASSLPFPKGLTSMALEAVMQRVASSLREYVERISHTD